MIVLKEFPDKSFATTEEAQKELIANKKTLIAQKKGAIKYADAVPYHSEPIMTDVNKAATDLKDATAITVKAVSNACNYYDSHGDVSINGSWTRTAKNTKDGLHLQEHEMRFDKLISDDVKFTVETKTWKELGFDYEGSTECLVMHSNIKKEINPKMFGMYVKGQVKNHSTGLRYVNIELAVNSSADWSKEEKEVWDKNYPAIVNKEEVDEYGYFWAVTEQKVIENSAVLRGSNRATPTISVEPADGTSAKTDDPAPTTHQSEQTKNFNLNLFI